MANSFGLVPSRLLAFLYCSVFVSTRSKMLNTSVLTVTSRRNISTPVKQKKRLNLIFTTLRFIVNGGGGQIEPAGGLQGF